MTIALRRAHTGDVTGIHALLVRGSTAGLLLPRSLHQIFTDLRDFFVLDQGGKNPVVGCCALAITWESMAEVRSLFVAEEMRGLQMGRRLVEACLEDAVLFHISRVFTLTYKTDFFSRLGFEEISKETLPQKIWTDCIHCPKFPNCDETAMSRTI
jgi:amino-acid N-acetyltransferase